MLSDVAVKDIRLEFRPVAARSPILVGARVVPEFVLCTASVAVETRAGRRAWGIGQGLLGDTGAFPDDRIPPSRRAPLLRAIAERAAACLLERGAEPAHPLDIALPLTAELDALGAASAAALELPPPPAAAPAQAFAPLDAALHDAWGRANQFCVWRAYTRDFMAHDLAHYLRDPAYGGWHPTDFFRRAPKGATLVMHRVGAYDTIREREVADASDDGLPNSLEGWIARQGMRALRVHLRGHDLNWDLWRTREVWSVAASLHRVIACDMREQSESPFYVRQYLERLSDECPDAFRRLAHVEQPTSRRILEQAFDWHAVSHLKSIVLHEGLESLRHLREAFRQGWSGAAIGIARGQSLCLLYHSVAVHEGATVTLRDFGSPGYGWLQTLAWAAWSDHLRHAEFAARQYFPWAAAEARQIAPECFAVKSGLIHTAGLRGTGLGWGL